MPTNDTLITDIARSAAPPLGYRDSRQLPDKAHHDDGILVTTSQEPNRPFPLSKQRLKADSSLVTQRATHIVVKGIETRPVADKHGQSRAENFILSESFHLLQKWPCLVVHTGCDGTEECHQRQRIDKLKKHVAIYQCRAGMAWPYNIDVLEGSPELHSHIVAAFPSASAVLDIGHRLANSATYGAWVRCGPVDDWRGLQNYLSKEATPQAWHGAGRSFRRLKINERFGSVSGDRVRPSRALEQELVSLGRIEPWTRTYAARTKPAPTPAVAVATIAKPYIDPGFWGAKDWTRNHLRQWVADRIAA